VPIVAGPNGTNQALYIGPKGEWGSARSSSGSSGGSAGGTGSSSIVWVKDSVYNPPSGGGAGGVVPPRPPLPPLPGVPELLDYVPALELIFRIASATLSSGEGTLGKKKILTEKAENLAEIGWAVQQYGLYDAMQPMMNGVYKSAYVPNGKLSKNVAIALGQDLAKQIAQSPVSVRLHSFETTLLAGTHVAVRQNGDQVAIAENGGLRSAIGSLARSYSRVMQMSENDEGYRDQQEDFSPVEGLWGNQGLYNYYNYTPGAMPVSAPVAYNANLPGLQKLLRGQASAVASVQFVDRLVRSATQVESLHRLYITWGERVPYIQYGGFLQELMEFGFEVMRVKPTMTVGSNPASEWIENLLEGNGSEASLKLVAEGLAQLFDGFKLDANSDSMYEVGDALDYLGRLVQAAEAVDDVRLDQEVLKASTLSYLVNLGSEYAQSSPTYKTILRTVFGESPAE
jgi:hypothetical protein